MKTALAATARSNIEAAHNQRLAARITERVVINAAGCWKWQGTIDPGNGYGRVCIDGQKLYAHRTSHIAFKGPIPAGLGVLHTCDCKDCVNPDHTYLGTQADNLADYVARTEKWERRGKLRAAQVLEIIDLRFSGGWSYLDLSAKFHASCQSIANVCRGRTHARLTGIRSDKPAPKLKTKAAAKLVAKAKTHKGSK